MSQVVLLDAGVLGLISNPRISANSHACLRWLDALCNVGDFPRTPAIADYEVRRELLRAGKQKGLARLDRLVQVADYLPLSPNTLRIAAQLWADARRQGRPTAPDMALDADVILAAQALEAENNFDLPAIVATENVDHLARFVRAYRWQDIAPTQPS